MPSYRPGSITAPRRLLGAVPRSITKPRLLGAVLLLILMSTPPLVSACAIDNNASLYVDGVRANFTTIAPTSTKTWAPFSVDKTFATNTTIVIREDQTDLARSLQPSMLHHAYRWTFGDGVAAVGSAGSHRYRTAGTYRLAVAGFDATTHRWVTFDSALVHVAAPGRLLQANLGYGTVGVVDVVVGVLSPLVDAALVALIVVVVVMALRPMRLRALPAGR